MLLAPKVVRGCVWTTGRSPSRTPLNDLPDQLRKARYFIKLDLKSGYHQGQGAVFFHRSHSGQGRGRTVIPGFAVQYISIMLPSQTRHLMCQSQTGCSSGSKAFSTYVVAGYHRGGEDYLFFIPCLAQSSKVATRPY